MATRGCQSLRRMKTSSRSRRCLRRRWLAPGHGYCLMGNHWHLVVWPREECELPRFVGWLTLTHTQRWHAHRKSTRSGHLYQGRFKSFPVQDDDHFHTVSRYVERNALRANLVKRAEDWRWGSLHRWYSGTTRRKHCCLHGHCGDQQAGWNM